MGMYQDYDFLTAIKTPQMDSLALNDMLLSHSQKFGGKEKTGLPVGLQKLGAALALLVLSPVLLLAMLAIRLESGGNIFYSQVRVGHQGRRFKIWKLRSMFLPSDPRWVDISTLKSDREGTCKKLFRDPRITKVGRVIRKLSIDELPQLWNVLTGDMVMIGPRPALPEEVDAYGFHMLERMNTMPGLTGLWQVSGRADTTFEEQINLDLRYVRNQSIWLDIKILFATVPAVLLGKGAY